MSATPVLAVSHDEVLLGLLRSTVRDQLGQKGRIAVAASVDDACPACEGGAAATYCLPRDGREWSIRTARPSLVGNLSCLEADACRCDRRQVSY